MEKSAHKLLLLERIADLERRQLWHLDVEDDPETYPLMPDKVDYLNQKLRNRIMSRIANRRKTLVSTGDRSAKIRTYNFQQGRVTDHRIGFTTHDLQGFLGGNIQEMIDALTVEENAERMKEAEL